MQWLTTEQAGEELGVSSNTIRRYCTERGLPYSNIGQGKAKIRISKKDLDAWVLSQNQAA